jgi:hypothetical protein
LLFLHGCSQVPGGVPFATSSSVVIIVLPPQLPPLPPNVRSLQQQYLDLPPNQQLSIIRSHLSSSEEVIGNNEGPAIHLSTRSVVYHCCCSAQSTPPPWQHVSTCVFAINIIEDALSSCRLVFFVVSSGSVQTKVFLHLSLWHHHI